MREYEKLPELIGDTYDAALDPSLWNGVLAKFMDFVRARACGLVLKDPVSRLGEHRYNVGLDPEYLRAYTKTYAKFDPMASLPRFGEVMSIPDLVSYDDYRQGRFYQEWLRPQGWADTAFVVLEKTTASAAFLAFGPDKTNSMVDDDMRRRIALLVPHARRALLIGKAMELRQTEAATFADMLDGLSAGMFLVDEGGRIVHANAAGHDMLYAGDFLRSADGSFSTRDPQANQTLREVFAAAATGDFGIGGNAIALPLTAHNGERYVAHVLPLTAGERRFTGLIHTAVAAVFVRKAEFGHPVDAVAQSYSLTPAELRVLLSIVEVGGVPETAVALGVAETTVKTHLYRLFDKAGVSRQADLVKLVAGYTNPLVG